MRENNLLSESSNFNGERSGRRIQGVDLINESRDVADYFHLDRGWTLRFAEFRRRSFGSPC